MKVRLVKNRCVDGIERNIVEYKEKWWQKWRPLHEGGKLAYVAYLGDASCKSVSDECFDFLGLNEEQRKARETMLRYILDAEEVYVGAKIGNEFYIGYDVHDDDSFETLRNLKE